MKIPFSFGYSFFLRAILPGIVFAFLSYGLFKPLITLLGPNSLISKNLGASFVLEIVIIGTIVSLCNLPILRFCHRGLWRRGLADWRVKKINEKIDKKRKEANKLLSDNRLFEFDQIWSWLSKFPIDREGNPRAFYPTKLGNIIYGYETRHRLTHGLDSAFFWYRVWLTLNTDTRKEISTASAEADCLIHCSAVSFVLSVVYLAFLIVALLKAPLSYMFPSRFITYISLFWCQGFVLLLILVAATILLSWLFYKSSLFLLEVVGEYFKSMFDVFYKRASEISFPSAQEREKLEKLFQYLHHFKVKCSKCGNMFPYKEDKCPSCGRERSDLEDCSNVNEGINLFWP